SDPLIADDAIARLHKASLGLPRALNNAAIAALIAAASAGKALVDDDCAKKAVAELTRDCICSCRNPRRLRWHTLPRMSVTRAATLAALEQAGRLVEQQVQPDGTFGGW